MITSRETHLSFVSPPLIFKGNRPRVFKVQTKQGHEVTSCTHKKKKQRKHMKKELNNYWGTATNYSIASRTIINRHKLRAMKQFDSIHATKSIGFKLDKPYDQSQKTRDRSSLSLPNPTKTKHPQISYGPIKSSTAPWIPTNTSEREKRANHGEGIEKQQEKQKKKKREKRRTHRRGREKKRTLLYGGRRPSSTNSEGRRGAGNLASHFLHTWRRRRPLSFTFNFSRSPRSAQSGTGRYPVSTGAGLPPYSTDQRGKKRRRRRRRGGNGERAEKTTRLWWERERQTQHKKNVSVIFHAFLKISGSIYFGGNSIQCTQGGVPKLPSPPVPGFRPSTPRGTRWTRVEHTAGSDFLVLSLSLFFLYICF